MVKDLRAPLDLFVLAVDKTILSGVLRKQRHEQACHDCHPGVKAALC